MAFAEVLLLFTVVSWLIYFWSKRSHNYWTRRGIPQKEPTPFIGNTLAFLQLKTNFGMHLSNIYGDKRFTNSPVVGIYIFHTPGLVIRDLEMIKTILIKDFNKFSNRYGAVDMQRDSLGSNNLFFVKNPYWREMRTKLTPVFTSGKIKQMYPLMIEIAKELETHLLRYTQDSKSEFIAEIKETCALFTTDLIASTAFGLRANSLQNSDSTFRRVCREIFKFHILRAKNYFIAFFLPKLVSILRVKILTKEYVAFVREIINHAMDEREKTGYVRNDLIDILLALKKSGTFDSKLYQLNTNNDFLVAQGSIFLNAGFETSSSTMSFALYELAKRPDLQERLREEICEALLKENGVISYDIINSLQYLGMVVYEILRLYPVLPILDREHNNIENNEPFSLKPHFNYELPKGMPVYVPLYDIQRDPKYWPDPNTFDPERFSNENKKLHHPMSFIAFGAGPHNCIGMRLGLLQSKLGLVHFLKDHRVSVCERTPKEIRFDPKAIILQSFDSLYLKITYDQMYNRRAKNFEGI